MATFSSALRTARPRRCAIDFLRVASSVPASTICALGDARGSTFIFLGSRVADSLLLQLGLRAADGGRRRAAPAIGGAAKRLRADDGDGGDGDDALEEDDEEDRARFRRRRAGGAGGLRSASLLAPPAARVKAALLLRAARLAGADLRPAAAARGRLVGHRRSGRPQRQAPTTTRPRAARAVLMCGGARGTQRQPQCRHGARAALTRR